MTTPSREVHLVRRPKGWPTPDDFDLVHAELEAPGAGQLLVRNLALSVDPYMRGRMNDAKSYVPPFELGRPMTGGAVGEVVHSEAEGFAPGDQVLHDRGWRETALVEAKHAIKIDASRVSPTAYLGVLGMTGLTAYVGLTTIAPVREGDVVFVSGAAGAVGSAAGQIARELGASQVIGSAGSAAKVDYVTDELGFDAAFDYHDGPVAAALGEAAPDGIDVYFDNVGGEHLEAALLRMNPFGRVAACGSISGYNATEPPPGPRTIGLVTPRRLSIRGYIVRDHYDQQQEFLKRATAWLEEGRLRYRETTVEGIDNAVDAFLGMLKGDNVGKMLVLI